MKPGMTGTSSAKAWQSGRGRPCLSGRSPVPTDVLGCGAADARQAAPLHVPVDADVGRGAAQLRSLARHLAQDLGVVLVLLERDDRLVLGHRACLTGGDQGVSQVVE